MDIFFSLVALTFLEVILGIDNLVFLTVACQRLPASQREKARKFGLTLAWASRLVLLLVAFWLVRLKEPIFTIMNHGVSIHGLFLMLGGLFLLTKATREIQRDFKIETAKEKKSVASRSDFLVVVSQIALFDMIFSVDSVLTAVGLTQIYWVMAVAITIAILLMLFASRALGHFIHTYPTLKMLALSFLMLIGMMLLSDGLGFHIPRAYLYVAMGFSLFVEMLNLTRLDRMKKKRKLKKSRMS